MMGNASVGKSSIVQKWLRNIFSQSTESTLGVAFVAKNIIVEDVDIRLEIWDTAGQERYAALMPLYYRNADIALIIFDVKDNTSLVSGIKLYETLDVPIKLLIGNKIDLVQGCYMFDDTLFSDKDVELLFTSAKTGEGIKEIFITACKKYLENKPHIKNYDSDEDDYEDLFFREKKRQLCC